MTMTISAGIADNLSSPVRPRAISRWLLAIAALVFLMVVIGGITRLTESGLSMVRWEPVSGVVPPLTDAEWQAEFEAYKAYPEYQKVNRGMSLAEFKNIFFWEYLHRLLGRLIGVAFALSLPIAFLALVPSGAVDETLFDVIEAVSALFPFKPALTALDAAISGGGLAGPLVHLLALTLGFSVLARLSLRRFA